MASFNKCIIMGNITADPEVKQTKSGNSAVSFSLAVNYKSGDEVKTDFISAVAFKQKADFIGKYFKKGDPALIEGALHIRQFTDKNGVNRAISEIWVDEVTFAPIRKADRPAPGGKKSKPTVKKPPEAVQVEDLYPDDDLPF